MTANGCLPSVEEAVFLGEGGRNSCAGSDFHKCTKWHVNCNEFMAAQEFQKSTR